LWVRPMGRIERPISLDLPVHVIAVAAYIFTPYTSKH
jgi:hypothetical protein